MRPAMRDGSEDLIIPIAVEPDRVAQTGPHASAGVSAVTTGAVVPIEEPVSILQCDRIVAVRVQSLVANHNPAGNRADARRLGGRRAHRD